MLEGAKLTGLRFARDESGVVLAITLVVFLTLFVMACSVYAVGETVRQRIELQNAADSAAYSAAVIQADALSRIAALNRAMAWNYAQLGRFEMDFIVDKWLWKVVGEYLKDVKKMVKHVKKTSLLCISYAKKTPKTWWIGRKNGTIDVKLNSKWVKLEDVIKKGVVAAMKSDPMKSSLVLWLPITFSRMNINRMNKMEQSIIRKFPKQIEKTVKQILKDNIKDVDNDRLSPARAADLRYAILPRRNEHKRYFGPIADEQAFFYMADINETPEDYFDDGARAGQWYQLVNPATAGGIQRKYVQRGRTMLAAYWQAWASYWKFKKLKCRQRGKKYIEKGQYVLGRDVRKGAKDPMFQTPVCKAQILKKSFFGADAGVANNGRGSGTIVVGVARRMNNPLQFMVPRKRSNRRGIFNVFTVDNDRRFMWSAAAARAGYKLPPGGPGDRPGEYEVTWRNVARSADTWWNLKQGDWDAVMLPLARAWSWGEDNTWKNGDTSGKVLPKLASRKWKGLYRRSHGGRIGRQRGPQGMRRRPANLKAANDDLVFH